VKGIDISNYQKGINLVQMKANGVSIVYLKVTEGLTWDDDCMLTFYNETMRLGLKIGFYHFIRTNDPVAEAKKFISRIKNLHADCLYMIDAERRDEAKGVSARIRAFSDYMASQGYPCCLYTYLDFYNTEILPIARNIPFWVAKYGGTRPNIKSVAWQYSEANNLDLDIFDNGILLDKPVNIVLTSQSASTKPILQVNETIRQLQCNLNLLHIADLSTDGLNGNLTIAAVKKFQSIMGLTCDGVLGPNTQNAISMILARPTDGVKFPHYNYATRYIQWRVGASIDGTYGNITASLVKVWQSKNGLVADGIVGNLGWKKLL